MIDPSNADKIEIISLVSKAKTNADKSLLLKLHYKLFGAFFSHQSEVSGGTDPSFSESAVRRCDKQTDRQTQESVSGSIPIINCVIWREFIRLLYTGVAQHNSEDFYFQLHIRI